MTSNIPARILRISPEEIGRQRLPSGVVEASQLFENGLRPDLAEAFKDTEERILASLQNLNANYIEAGRLLRSVGQGLSRGHFHSWVTTAFGLSPRTARMIMRAAGRADPSTGLLRRQKLAPRLLTKIIRAATEQRPTPNKPLSQATSAGEAAPHDCSRTSGNEELRQDDIPATLEGDVAGTSEIHQDIASWSRARGYAVRHLVRRYGVSATIAAVIVAELGMGGVQ
jgi:hypothetical protein